MSQDLLKARDPAPVLKLSEDLDRFDGWREAISLLFDVGPLDAAVPRDREVDLTSWLLGPMVLGACRSNGHRFDRSAAVIARSGIDHILVQLLIEGEDHLLSGAPAASCRPGDVRILDLGRNAATVTSPYRNLSLVMPRDSLAPLVADIDRAHGLVLAGDSTSGRLLADHLKSLHAAAPAMTVQEAALLTNGTAGLIAACIGAAADRGDLAAAALVRARLRTMQDHIEETLFEPGLGPDSLMRRFGLSRSRLYDHFAPLGGVEAYIRRRRLRAALKSLSGVLPPRIGALAHLCGFASESSFSRAFRAEYGVSPREIRGLGSALPTSGADLAAWLRAL